MDGDWDEPAAKDTIYGNSDIKEANVITVKDLKTKYKNEISTLGVYKQIDEDLQLKVVVTANDIEGNMYNEICVQDETGGIFIGISQGGIFGYLPVGTEILIDLKGLCIGNYRRSATIGTPYTSKDGEVSVSRMPRALWQQHFTYTGYREHVTPELFADGSTPTTWDLTMDAGNWVPSRMSPLSRQVTSILRKERTALITTVSSLFLVNQLLLSLVSLPHGISMSRFQTQMMV